jgi:hypothetical protein
MTTVSHNTPEIKVYGVLAMHSSPFHSRSSCWACKLVAGLVVGLAVVEDHMAKLES